MLDEIRPAAASDFDAVWQLYTDVCAQAPADTYSAQWVLGVYPTEQDIRTHIEAGELHVGLKGGRIVAAMVLLPHEDPEYAAIPWPTPTAPDEACAIHLLCVHPCLRGQHVGVELVRAAIRLARQAGKRAIHLDVLPGNLAASRIYLEAGFAFVGTHEIFYEDTGTMPFEMYEYAL